MKAFFFGCWNQAGHYLFRPGGQSASAEEDTAMTILSEGTHIDATLAPRKHRWLEGVFFLGAPMTRDARSRLQHDSSECAQGQFLVHHISGFTYMAWWDRCQGDTRGACNSTFILEGTHDAAKMVEELKKLFPHVVENLRKKSVELVEVKR